MAAAAQGVSNVPAAVNITCYQGDDLYLDLTVTADGRPADLTGYTAKSQIRTSPASDEISAEIDAVVDEAAGVVRLHLTHAAATDLGGLMVWDCELTDAVGNVSTIAAGKLTVEAEVTR